MNRCVLVLYMFLVCSCSYSGKNCEIGSQRECTCSDGAEGTQICEDDGSGWGECDCEWDGPEIYVDVNMRNLCNYNVSVENETRCLEDADCFEQNQFCWFSPEAHFQGKRGFCRECESSAQCSAELQCDYGWCHLPCAQDSECESTEFCTGGFCRKPYLVGTEFNICNGGNEDLEVYLDQVTLHGNDEACVFSRFEWSPLVGTATLAPNDCDLYLTVKFTPKDPGEFRGFIKIPNNSVNYSPLLILMCGQAVESTCHVSEDETCPDCASCQMSDFEEIIAQEPIPDCNSFF